MHCTISSLLRRHSCPQQSHKVICAVAADFVSSMDIGGLVECVTGLLESPLVRSPLVHAKLVELLMCMLRSDVRGQGSSASRALVLAVLGACFTLRPLSPAGDAQVQPEPLVSCLLMDACTMDVCKHLRGYCRHWVGSAAPAAGSHARVRCC